MQRRQFTLIELLIVISIIMILVAMLMPSLQRVKRKAMTVACLNNLKQCGMGATMMASEKDNKFVYIKNNTQKERYLKSGSVDIRPDLDPYVDWNAWKCAFFAHLPNADSALNTGNVQSNFYYWPGQDYYLNNGSTFYTSYKMQKNGETNVLMQDLLYWYGGNTAGYRLTHGDGIYWSHYADNPSYAWYKAGKCLDINLVYADGHAKNIPFSMIEQIGTNSSGAKIYSTLP